MVRACQPALGEGMMLAHPGLSRGVGAASNISSSSCSSSNSSSLLPQRAPAPPRLTRRHAVGVQCQQQQQQLGAEGILPSSSGRGSWSSTAATASFRELLVGQVTIAGATAASSFIILPRLSNGGGGGPGGRGGGGGGGGGDGGDGMPGGEGSQPLFDIAEDTEASDATATPEPEHKQEDVWKELVTPSDEIEAEEGERSGTNRCVEVVIEGWPTVGSLPAEVCGCCDSFRMGSAARACVRGGSRGMNMRSILVWAAFSSDCVHADAC